MRVYDFEWQILNEVRDLANFKSVDEAVSLVARHYKISEELLLNSYYEYFSDEEEEDD